MNANNFGGLIRGGFFKMATVLPWSVMSNFTGIPTIWVELNGR